MRGLMLIGLIFCAFCLCACGSHREVYSFLRDSSFTNRTAFEKEIKKFPHIRPANMILQKNIRVYENINYTKQGRKLKLDIYRPLSDKKLPVILFIHGGGWKSGDRSMMKELAVALANRGFIGLCIEYRLSPEARYPAALIDLKEGIRWIRMNARRYGADEDRIAVFGVSSGAQLASLIGATNGTSLWTGTGLDSRHSSDVQAVVNVDGILAFKHEDSEEGQLASEWLGGPYEEIPAIWEEASALTHASEASPPVLFINSQFKRFHAGRDEYIQRAGGGNKFRILTIPDSPHTFWMFEPWFPQVVDGAAAFLKEVFGLSD